MSSESSKPNFDERISGLEKELKKLKKKNKKKDERILRCEKEIKYLSDWITKLAMRTGGL